MPPSKHRRLSQKVVALLAVGVLEAGIAPAVASGQYAGLTRPSGLVAPGSTLAISWQGIAAPSGVDWIGLYTPGSADNPDGSLITYVYTGGGSSGTTAFPIPRGIPVGDYSLRLFSNNTYTRLAWLHLGIVHPGYGSTIWSTSGQNAVSGKPYSVSWQGIVAPSTSDWIGLYSATGEITPGSYLSFMYTGGASSGRIDFSIPGGLAPGLYRLILFTNDSYTIMSYTNIGVASK